MTSSVTVQDTKLDLLSARTAADGGPTASQVVLQAAYGPPETKLGRVGQAQLLVAKAGEEGQVTTKTSQATLLIAYGTGVPFTNRTAAWTFILDGHRFYVLPLGPEGDWAYDTTTQEWCKLQTQGFPGLNFTHGTMWGLRVMGGDSLFSYLYELDPTQSFDEGFREVEHRVTGGIPMRGRSVAGVANFTLTASAGDDAAIDSPISLAFSDDNGMTYSQEFDLPLSDMAGQQLIWNALGSFSAPGRIFRITDFAGPVRLDGADCVLTIGNGADSSQDQEGQHKQ